MLASGAAIVSGRGVPGTLGFLAIARHDRRLVLVTSHHVLFDADATPDEPVWLDRGACAAPRFDRAGRAAYGRAGVVRSGGTDVWVDCAAAYVDTAHVLISCAHESSADPSRSPDVGVAVTKLGAATGTTRGIVADVHYTDAIASGSRTLAAPEQILVRPRDGSAFCAAGDSGAALRDERGTVIGLLWGCTPRGEGVACPIAPVLHVLNADLLRGGTPMPEQWA